VPPLLALLAEPPGNPHGFVAEALGRLGDARAVEPLIAAIPRGNIHFRYHAAKVLGEFGDARAVPVLQWMQAHDTGYVGDGCDKEFNCDVATAALGALQPSA
jgi:HEAT repeat protein